MLSAPWRFMGNYKAGLLSTSSSTSILFSKVVPVTVCSAEVCFVVYGWVVAAFAATYKSSRFGERAGTGNRRAGPTALLRSGQNRMQDPRLDFKAAWLNLEARDSSTP